MADKVKIEWDSYGNWATTQFGQYSIHQRTTFSVYFGGIIAQGYQGTPIAVNVPSKAMAQAIAEEHFAFLQSWKYESPAYLKAKEKAMQDAMDRLMGVVRGEDVKPVNFGAVPDEPWWLQEMHRLWNGGDSTLDTRRAALVVCNIINQISRIQHIDAVKEVLDGYGLTVPEKTESIELIPDEFEDHRSDWRQALMNNYMRHVDNGTVDDAEYWKGELEVFDKAFEELRLAGHRINVVINQREYLRKSNAYNFDSLQEAKKSIEFLKNGIEALQRQQAESKKELSPMSTDALVGQLLQFLVKNFGGHSVNIISVSGQKLELGWSGKNTINLHDLVKFIQINDLGCSDMATGALKETEDKLRKAEERYQKLVASTGADKPIFGQPELEPVANTDGIEARKETEDNLTFGVITGKDGKKHTVSKRPDTVDFEPDETKRQRPPKPKDIPDTRSNREKDMEHLARAIEAMDKRIAELEAKKLRFATLEDKLESRNLRDND